MTMIKQTVCVLAAALALSLTACSDHQEEKVVKISFSNVTSESARQAGERFKEIAEAESGGTLKINIFPDNQLGDDRVVVETTRFGDIDIGVSSTSPIATMYSDFYIFDIPFLFLGKEDAYAKLDGETGQQILDGMEDIGLKGLAFWENGFRSLTTVKKPVHVPDDLKGIKVRTMENEIHIAAWKSFGANPTPMAHAEVFTALQQGTIDAAENAIGVIDVNKFMEVQEHISLTEHVYTPYIVCMNLEKFHSLTARQQEAILKAAKESTDYQRELSSQYEAEIVEGFKNEGKDVIEITEDEKSLFQQKVIEAGIFELVKGKVDHPDYVEEWLKRDGGVE